MLRREPTTIQLTSDDLAELQDNLEEFKLLQQIKSQHMDLVRSSTRVGPPPAAAAADEPRPLSCSFQISPLNKQMQQQQQHRRAAGAGGLGEQLATQGIVTNTPVLDERDTSNPFIQRG
ncbi:ADL091Cp [Eremothecium gossypii ATCC 10895]|uniref:ADL091Cp n=1 Tax=Eremothecium gossypii (strain ATCC 10895 / CBS 109.51 / FGSC 9923 / NRRL Y-1056) TaxID=284811 RepID=Q75B01_EREGS|nr:ADL091Cp [Eremothecium gossypii ATCC 10895]AAS51829.1 ADL091Cp [Eremothecium gossypii ATCC 10895]AEY96126.1 FADL091Cp [Eremothecium gossypii FDAG1]